MRKLYKLGVFCLGIAFCFSAQANTSNEYFRYQDDASIENWTYESVQELRKSGIMKGFSDGSFRPTKAVTRAEALTLIFKINEIDSSEVDVSVLKDFSDVHASKWYAKPFAKAVNEGWLNGYKDKTLRPHNSVTRAEWASMVQKVYGLEPDAEKIPQFIDVASDAWYKSPIDSLYRYGLLFNDKHYDFLPKQKLTRQEAAWLTYAVQKKKKLFTNRDDINQHWKNGKIPIDRSAWYKQKNFLPDKQGTAVERKALSVTVASVADTASVVRGKDFVEIGTLELANPFETDVTLDTLELTAFFNSKNVGPVNELEIKMILNGTTFTKMVDRSGKLLLSQMGQVIGAEKTVQAAVFVRASADGAYLLEAGTGTISMDRIDVWNDEKYEGSDEEKKGQVIRKITPFKFEVRTFKPFDFSPVLAD